MPKHGRTKLVPQSTKLPVKQSLEVTEESSLPEQRELQQSMGQEIISEPCAPGYA